MLIPDPLPGEHQANDIPTDVDWEKLNESREKLKLKKPEKKDEH